MTTTAFPTTVLRSEWGTSYHTSSAFEGCNLSVKRLVDEPNEHGGVGNTHRHPIYDGIHFPTSDAARFFALLVGLVRPYTYWGAK
jgi:hypothetical protein